MLYKLIAMRKRKDLPFIERICFGARPLYWAYRSRVDQVDFHVIEDGKLIIAGAKMANSLPDGLYLDCVPSDQTEMYRR